MKSLTSYHKHSKVTEPYFFRKMSFAQMDFRLRHLREHKFRHNFNDTINPFCLRGSNSLEIFFALPYLCLFMAQTNSLTIFEITNSYFYHLDKSVIIKIILYYGSDNYDPSVHKIILYIVINFITQSKRFDDPLIQC